MLAGVGRGLSNDEIAAEIHISPATARTYVSRMLTKLELAIEPSWLSSRTRAAW